MKNFYLFLFIFFILISSASASLKISSKSEYIEIKSNQNSHYYLFSKKYIQFSVYRKYQDQFEFRLEDFNKTFALIVDSSEAAKIKEILDKTSFLKHLRFDSADVYINLEEVRAFQVVRNKQNEYFLAIALKEDTEFVKLTESEVSRIDQMLASINK